MNEKQLHLQSYDEPIEGGKNTHSERVPEKYGTQTDATLWNAFRKGDEEALVYIYKEYANKLYNYGCQFTTEKELVSDSIQELFTEIISKRHQLGSTHSIKFYLFKALRRKLMRVLKKEKKYLSGNELTEHAGFNILEDTSIKFMYQEFNQQQKAIIASECNKLPPKQKEALLLYFYEGMSYKEIAATTGMSRTKSARALIYRALDSLSVHLQKYKDILYPLWPVLLTSPLL